MKKQDQNVYLVCEYYATGEGETVAILITRAHPINEDYLEIDDTISNNTNFIVKNNKEERALREFEQIFGKFFSQGVEILDRYEFFHKYEKVVPPFLYDMCDPNREDYPANFEWQSKLHFNYS